MQATGENENKRVVIVGAGFGGLEAARALRDAQVDVLLVDQHNYHTFQPLLYQVATAGLEPEEIAHAVRAIYHEQGNFRFRMGRVSGVDWDERLVLFDGEPPSGFDFLVLALGTVTADYGIAGVREHAFALKSLADAIRLRNHVLELFERAARDPTVLADGALHFLVVGGGPTGVEMSGALVELIDKVLRKDYPHLDLSRARVTLIERDEHLLGPYHPESQRYALAQLEKRGVEVRLGTSVARVGAEAVVLAGGETIPTRTLIWAAGVRAHPLAGELDLPVTRDGRIVVDADLSVPGRRGLFAIGDLAASKDTRGQAHPQLAPVAIQGGRHVARAIADQLAGRKTSPFVYKDRGTMATIGRNAAVAELRGGIRTRGYLAWMMWLGLHLIQLIGFRNRLNVLINWFWNYVTWDRSARLILDLEHEGARWGERRRAEPDPRSTPESGGDESAGKTQSRQ